MRYQKMDSMEFDHINHVKLWLWLSENPALSKQDWPEWKSNGGSIKNASLDCMACRYVKWKVKMLGDCMSANYCSLYCPLIWPDNKNCCSADGLYTDWCREKDLDAKSKLALRMSKLPVRKAVVIR